jgi:hyperosmotically inducible periplasmic protein
MKNLLIGLSAFGLAFAGCDKKSTPTVGPEPTMREKADQALRTAADNTKEAAQKVGEKTKEVAADVRDAFNRKRTEWRLNDSDIKTELEKTGRVVRKKAAVAGQRIGEAYDVARITTTIKGKLVADPELSAWNINVDTDKNGVVTLTGNVKSLDAVARALWLALDTEGVNEVVALLRVEP